MFSSWPGLSRPSTSLELLSVEDVDARHKAGHDGSRSTAVGVKSNRDRRPRPASFEGRAPHDRVKMRWPASGTAPPALSRVMIHHGPCGQVARHRLGRVERARGRAGAHDSPRGQYEAGGSGDLTGAGGQKFGRHIGRKPTGGKTGGASAGLGRQTG
jgi:hypothetical protein